MNDNTEEQGMKRVEFYSQAVSAWFQTSLEKDRSLLYLSSGGIAVLISLFSDITDSSPSPYLKVIFLLSALSFFACLLSVLRIFSINKDVLSEIINDRKPISDCVAKRLDILAIVFFGSGAALMIVIGIFIGSK